VAETFPGGRVFYTLKPMGLYYSFVQVNVGRACYISLGNLPMLNGLINQITGEFIAK
jgi:hypothetical protein